MIRNGKGTLYLEVTRDKYEYPIHITETIAEMSKITGVEENTIARQIGDFKRGIERSDKSPHWFRCVDYDENDNYDDLSEVNNEELKSITMDYINRDYDEYIKSEGERLEKQREYNRRKYYKRKARQKAKNS